MLLCQVVEQIVPLVGAGPTDRQPQDDNGSDAGAVESGDDLDPAEEEERDEVLSGTAQARGGDVISQYAQRTALEGPSTPTTQVEGTIMTDSGPIDASLAADFHLSADESSEDGDAEDAREAEENENLSNASNRLGGQDLRNMLNANGKRSPAEGARTDGATNGATYAKGKRVRVKQRLDEIGKDVDALERQQATSNGGLMSMLLVLQKDSDRRAEAEERRRRDERGERLEIEKREREERERARQEEARAAESRRHDEIEAARLQREELRREEAARQTRLELEREESKRRFEERMALDRAEARQRHEQMMLVLKNMLPK
ncbi:hypothetical protein PHYSODRAFT_316280 [Phytophthora sojae]|uniref:Uncharacterized protein n=1 Tax=Phytophthora sojae (strain P6497) TaxID=1094619 RepID=G4ZLF1_PHYSP|nr:hypothetical protein PHYSODRAFT_316280 [Phytophthora sojae]EGZ16233.1 hypothetical protein PHYSODRAFT_316280 [Phytophthora sojae]|eukprot:XP_009529982.1 hypothetical protein PHYSODRAFT_316280 [Phytophthora sojae]